MDMGKKYHSLKHNRNFEKLTVEYLLVSLAKNIDYIFLVLVLLGLFNFVDFNIRTHNFPHLSIAAEIVKIKALGYNPFTIYGHFIWTFFEVTWGFAAGFVDTIRADLKTGLIVPLLIVNCWLAYSKMRYGYDSRSSEKHNAFIDILKNYLFSSTLLERSLWMMFFVDIILLLTRPGKNEILALIVLYGLIISVKLVPWVARLIISLSERLEKTIMYKRWLLLAIGIIDAVLIYFDSTELFTLFLMIILYNLVASLVFTALNEAKRLRKYVYYMFNLGILIFFASIILIYSISFIVVIVMQLPIIVYFYWKNKWRADRLTKVVPIWVIEGVNMIVLAVLLVRYF